MRLITPEGYTIIYQENKPTILHPDGGISIPPKKFINKSGKGINDNHLEDISCLKRKKDNCIVTKRDDGTIIGIIVEIYLRI